MFVKYSIVFLSIAVLAISDNTSTPNPTSSTPSSTSKEPPPSTSTTSPVPTTTMSTAEECALLNASCKECLSKVKCLWCEDGEQKCLPYPSGQVIPHKEVCSLKHARWGVCWVNYEVLLIIMGIVAGIILITIACCCYCCCCRSKKGTSKKLAKEDARVETEREERRVKHDERKKERRAKYDEIRKKYGLINDDQPPYERFDA